jgi:copper chaperone
METVTLHVPGMSCSHCEQTIKKAVTTLDGVNTIDIDLEGKTVEVAFIPGKVTKDVIITAIEEQGYDVS